MAGSVDSKPSVASAAPAPRVVKKAPSRAARGRSETHRIVMRPPYDLKRQQVALTCGYHDSCKRRAHGYAGGHGLDWNDNNGTIPETKDVFFTASVHAPVRTRVATVNIEWHPAGRDRGYPCHTTVVNVRAYPSGKQLFRVMYQHVAPIKGLKSFPLYSVPTTGKSAPWRTTPNVVARIGRMVDDPCPYFTRRADGTPLLHAHVEPYASQPYVTFSRNTARLSNGLRVIPEVNGCRGACGGPVYPGQRWRLPYWQLWTHAWSWRVNGTTGQVLGPGR